MFSIFHVSVVIPTEYGSKVPNLGYFKTREAAEEMIERAKEGIFSSDPVKEFKIQEVVVFE